MERSVIAVFALLALTSASFGQSCQGTGRTRVTTPPTVYFNSFSGSDANDGMTAATALATLQRAFDCAASNFDVQIQPGSWRDPIAFVGYRPGVTIQVAATNVTGAHQIPTQPVFADGLGTSGPIYLRGDPANPQNYKLNFQNGYQGITAQDGAVVIVDGLTLSGNSNITLLNCLRHGVIAVRNTHLAQGMQGAVGGLGADNCTLDVIGDIWIDGPQFVSVFEAISLGRITFARGVSIHIDQANVNVGTLFAIGALSTVIVEGPGGGLIQFVGSGLSSLSGSCYSLSRNAVHDFQYTCPLSYFSSFAGPGTWFANSPLIVKGTDDNWYVPSSSP
jgi:hypothetical protein